MAAAGEGWRLMLMMLALDVHDAVPFVAAR